MTNNEKMVWAAAYAGFLVKARSMQDEYGITPNIVTIVEDAWDAVTQMREALPETIKAFGEDSEQVEMLKEMIGDTDEQK